MDTFCNDKQGWGPLNESKNDLTPCTQSVVLFAPVNALFILFGIHQLFQLFKSIGVAKRQSRANSDFKPSTNLWCVLFSFDGILSVFCTSGFVYALIAVYVAAHQHDYDMNYILFSVPWFLVAWVVFTLTYYVERGSVLFFSQGVAPSALTRYFWIIQFLLALKNVESLLVSAYNATIDLHGEYQRWYYVQCFAVIPFFVLCARGIFIQPLQSDVKFALDSQFFPSKLSVQTYKPMHGGRYSELGDGEDSDADHAAANTAANANVMSAAEQAASMSTRLDSSLLQNAAAAPLTSRVIGASSQPEENKLKQTPLRYRKTVEERASLWSIWTFGWLSKVFWRGFKTELQMNDLDFLKSTDHTHESIKLFYQKWRLQLSDAKAKNIAYEAKHPSGAPQLDRIDINNNNNNNNNMQQPLMRRHLSDPGTAPTHERADKTAPYQPSLVRAIMSAFGGPFYAAGPLKLLYDVFQYAGPVLLSAYLADAQEFDKGGRDNINTAYVYAALLFVTYMCTTLILAQYFHRCFSMGMRVRSALMAACYDKSLALSQSARAEKSTGAIMTMVTVDVRKVRDVFPYTWMMVSAPFQIGMAIYLLYQQIGWSVFVGIGVQTLFMAPLQIVVGKNARLLQKEVMKIRDQRMKVVNEVFGAMKIVKMYAWETSFGRKITGIRSEELAILRCYCWWYTLMVLFWGWAPTLVSLTAFITYLAQGHELTAQKAFVSISLFNLLRFPLAALPMVVLSFIEAKVCLGRLGEFLMCNEINPHVIERAPLRGKKFVPPPSKAANGNGNVSLLTYGDGDDEEEEKDENGFNFGNAISIRNAQFTWDDDFHQTALHDVNVDFPHATTTMVIGQTGAGKSALLRAILGNLAKSRGSIVYGESRLHLGTHIKVAYSSQVAWIQNAKLVDNILFDSPFDQRLYDQVVEACALTDDLKILPGGDDTEIGEKGINLSGGQKQRISLARAVYSNADVYVFDDPLSAVDSHVANHIFSKCFLQLLKGKTIILATHAVSFLKYADNILVMDNGSVAMQGQLQQLIDANINLTKFIIHSDKEQNPTDGSDAVDGAKTAAAESDAKESDEPPASPTRKSDKKTDKPVVDKGQLVKDEERSVGDVEGRIYWLYVQAAGGVLLFVGYIGVLGAYYVAGQYATFWLGFWSDAKIGNHEVHKSQWWWMMVYSAIQVGSVLLLFSSAVLALVTRLRASKNLHDSLLSTMLTSPMSFFDTTPIGRIINRFARDLYAVDQAVPTSYQSVIRTCLYLVIVTVGVCIVTPWLAISFVPLGILYYYLQKFFIATSRDLRRLSTLQNSPIYSNFSESINGVDVLRSFAKTQQFSAKNQTMIDFDHEAYYPSIAANRWLAIRLELIGNCLIGAAAFLCAATQPPAGLVGVALSTVMSVTQGLNWFVRQKAQLEQDVVSVERLDQYSNDTVPQERPHVLPNSAPPAQWPSTGAIEFKDVWMKYRENLEYVLKGLSFVVAGGQKVGVIGRTGAGKSSLFVTLLRLVEAQHCNPPQQSQIVIDGVDISTIGLQDLRSKLSVIPQDPVLFTGTVRFNLDPFEQHSDERLLEALKLSHCHEAMQRMVIEVTVKKERDELQKERVKQQTDAKKKRGGFLSKLCGKKNQSHNNNNNANGNAVKADDKEEVDKSEQKESTKIDYEHYMNDPAYADLNPLDIEVEENGGNFSVGQRQLLCLARAIVRGSKILLLDEATSAVDPQTDQLIQETIRSVFKSNTILTIAHRIDTILDYDRILIMDNGKVLEYDTPKHLLSDKSSKLSDIVQESFGVNLDDVLKNKLSMK